MKKFVAAILLLVATVSFSQVEELNKYKFAIVPSQFSFLKEKDQYQLNTFTKMYMEKYGFTVFFDGDLLPPEAAGDNCNKLFVDVVAESSMFSTKITIVLRDCMNNEVYRSDVGKSRDKDYKISYRQALREAFKSFDTLEYKYNGGNGIRGSVTQPAIAKIPAVPATPERAPVVVDKNTLFAQPTDTGYQLIDTTPKVVFKLKKTSSDKVFLAEKGELTGTLIGKHDGKWVFEYYLDGKLMTESVSIKF